MIILVHSAGSVPDPEPQCRWARLIRLAKNGQGHLFGTVFEKMRPLLVTRLMADVRTQNLFLIPQDVDEALQEAALKAWRGFGSYQPSDCPVPWFWSIVRNTAIDILRRRSRRRTISVDSVDKDGEPIAIRLTDSSAGPVTVLESGEEAKQRQVWQAWVGKWLAAQDEIDRLIWVWRLREGKPYCDISRELGIPIKDVKRRLHRRKTALRRQLRHMSTWPGNS